MGVGVLFLAASFLAPASTGSSSTPQQESQNQPQPQPAASTDKKIVIDFSDEYEHLSEDLEKNLRWKKLFGKFGIAEVQIFPARETGPYLGPPMRIWGNGWGTSMWRDPITGWAIQ
jgi:hypothetical protein